MKIEVGKFFKTRDGHKVRIYAVDCGYDEPVHGAMLIDDQWVSESWDYNKKHRCDDDFDIISEWEDPKPRLKAWIRNHPERAGGGYVVFGSSPKDEDGWKRAPWLDEPEAK